MMKNDPKERAKQAAAKAAVEFIQDGMLIGLGTGSTAAYFIESLILKIRHSNLHISAVATSERSAHLAKSGNIPIIDANRISLLDMTVDGADEVDPRKRMIKGGGGALLREKILASLSHEMVVIIDEDKLVDQLGAFPLPIEVVPFAHEATLNKIRLMDFIASFRRTSNGDLYITDNGNYIIDITFLNRCEDPEHIHSILRSIPGVVDTGFFLNLAGRVIIGHPDGRVDILP